MDPHPTTLRRHQAIPQLSELLRAVLESQERERRHVATKLHEHEAQALAAVLLGLDALSRDPGAGPAADQMAGLRSKIDDTLASLRQLAVSLRPPILDGLGLVSALEQLGTNPSVEAITIDGRLERVTSDKEHETALYRTVEDAVRAMRGSRSVSVRVDPDLRQLIVSVRPSAGRPSYGELGPLRARLHLLGGSLDCSERGLTVRVALPGAGGPGSAWEPR